MLLLSMLGALAGMILFLKFLHELSLTVRDLFLILKSHLGVRDVPADRQAETPPH